MKKRKGGLWQRIMSELLSALLAACMVFNVVPVSAQADTNLASGKDWVLAADGTLTISSDEGIADWKANGRADNCGKAAALELSNVTAIPDSAFYGCQFTEVVIPEGVKSVGSSSFASCYEMTSVRMADTVETIGSNAFSDCRVLETAELSDSIETIGNGAFEGCSVLKNITLPKNLKNIVGYAFGRCSSLQTLQLPEGLQTIGTSAFYACGKLETITIPAAVTQIESSAFGNCLLLESITFSGNEPPTLGNYVFGRDTEITGNTFCKFVQEDKQGIHVPAGKADTYKAAQGWSDWAKYIVEDAQADTNLASGKDWVLAADGTLTISSDEGMADWKVNGRADNCGKAAALELSNVTAIPDNAFRGCQFTEVVIPEGVKSVGGNSFSSCNKITSVRMADTVETIGSDAFSYCRALETAELSDSIEAIGDSAFDCCSSLKNITLPKNLKNIGEYAFADCHSLQTLQLPEGLQTIGECAFYACGKLEKITIPAAVTQIDFGAFDNCLLLDSITFSGNEPPTLENFVFGRDDNSFCKFVQEGKQGIHVPAGKADTYKAAQGWSNWAKYIVEDAQADTNLASGKDWVLAADGTLTISSDEGIADWKANGRANNCGKAAALELSNVTAIPDNAFYGCQFTEVVIPEGVKSVGSNSFASCYGMTSVRMADTVETIGSNAFRDCRVLETAELSDSIETIGNGAFEGCSVLKNITLPKNLKNIVGYAFADCSSLQTLQLPEGLQTIGTNAFNSCGKLETITIPAAVTQIDSSAFGNCLLLESITFSGNEPPTLGNYVFGRDTEITGNTFCKFVQEDKQGIHVPAGKADTYKAAQGWSDWAKYIVEDAQADTQPPVGRIEIGDNSWTDFRSEITFGLYFNESKQAAITSSDEGGSGADKTYYCISDKILTKAQAEALPAASWTQGDSVLISPDKRCVIYVKVTDKAGNAAYLSSDGLVFDATAPVISGVTDGATYNKPQNVSISDTNLERVTLNGIELTNQDGGEYTFELNAADAPQTIIATDKAGNITSVTVTVKAEGGDHPGTDAGKFEQDVQKDDKAPVTQVSTPADKLADIVLTTEEKQQLKDGTNIRIVLDVRDASGSVSSRDKALVETSLKGGAADGFVVGQYLDISLFKIINETQQRLSETNGKITVTINVPDSLANTDSARTRTFAVIRVHDGRAELLKDTDNSGGTITIETDRFSTYAIVYKDATDAGDDNSGGDSGNSGDNNGGDSGNSGDDNAGRSGNANGGNAGNSGNDNGGANGSEGGDNNGGDSGNGAGANNGDTPENSGTNSGAQKGDGAMTGDNAPFELYATLSMIAGFAYLKLYFADREGGMTEEKKKELVASLAAWAKRGGRLRKCLAFAAIFVLLAYYHITKNLHKSAGRKTCRA